MAPFLLCSGIILAFLQAMGYMDIFDGSRIYTIIVLLNSIIMNPKKNNYKKVSNDGMNEDANKVNAGENSSQQPALPSGSEPQGKDKVGAEQSNSNSDRKPLFARLRYNFVKGVKACGKKIFFSSKQSDPKKESSTKNQTPPHSNETVLADMWQQFDGQVADMADAQKWMAWKVEFQRYMNQLEAQQQKKLDELQKKGEDDTVLLKQQIEPLNKSVTTEQNRADKAEKALKSANDQLKNAHGRLIEEQATLSSLKGDLNTMRQSKELLQRQLDKDKNLKAEHLEFQTNIRDLKTKVLEITKRNDTLNEEVKSNLAEYNKILEGWKKGYENLKKESETAANRWKEEKKELSETHESDIRSLTTNHEAEIEKIQLNNHLQNEAILTSMQYHKTYFSNLNKRYGDFFRKLQVADENNEVDIANLWRIMASMALHHYDYMKHICEDPNWRAEQRGNLKLILEDQTVEQLQPSDYVPYVDDPRRTTRNFRILRRLLLSASIKLEQLDDVLMSGMKLSKK